MKMNKKVIFVFILIVATIFFYIQNNMIGFTYIDIVADRLPRSFDGFRIVHLSDLHSKLFGENQGTLTEKIRSAKPDLIVFTGDLIDSKRYEEEKSMVLIDEIINISSFYYVTGNHEHFSGKFSSLEGKLKERGVVVLRNENDVIERNDDKILIAGIDDPAFNYKNGYYNDSKIVSDELEKAIGKSGQSYFKILLSHRPEQFSVYAGYGIDLIFAGHAHGGQVRLPFIGGIVAPNQGYFPKYTAGKYTEKSSVMVVSRGLGNSIIPQRIFNRPEIVVTTFRRE